MISKEKVEYSKKILYSYLVKKRRNIPIHKLSYLSSGSFADAFRYKDRVFKITSSYEDFKMAQKITEGNYSSFTTCYSLDAIEFEGEKLFIIETKYEGKTIGDLFNEDSINFIICDFLCDWFCYSYHNTEIPEVEDLARAYAEILDIYGKKVSDSPDKLRELFVDSYLFYKVLFTEFTKLGGLAFDYHVHNVCYSNGKLKVIDFGCGGNFKYAKKDEINFIKVNYPKYEFLKNLFGLKRMKFLKN